jgi:hypothetical protein
MLTSDDGTPSGGDARVDGAQVDGAQVGGGEEQVLERQLSARRVAEQTWPEFFRSLAIRTVVTIALVLAVFFVLKLILG